MFNAGRSLFPKQERMVSRLLIETLFGGGCSHSMAAFPLRVVYMTRERRDDEAPIQLLISVPKKHFKHAVDRNRVKRQITGSLPDSQQLLIACVWLSDRQESSLSIEQKLVSLMRRIGEKL